MSSPFSSPVDEFGSGRIIQGFRRISDIATDQGDYYLLKSGPFSRIQKFTNILMDKPMIIPAGRTFTHMSEGGNWLYTNFTDPAPPMFSTFGLKEGIITGFTDNGASGTTVASTAHGGNDGDTFTIIGSRVKEYDINAEIFNVLTDSFDIPVLFNGADGQSRFTQSKLRISAMSDGGAGFSTPPIVTIDPPTEFGTTATATVTISNGKIDGFTITDPGSGYTEVPNVSVALEFEGTTASLSDTINAGVVDSLSIVNAGSGITLLDMVNHQLDVDISMNITNTTNGLSSATYVIAEIVDADTVSILATFPGSTGTADSDMSYGIIDYTNETFFNFTGNATPPQCFNMQGNGGSILVFNSSNIADFDVGEVRDHFSVNFRGGSAIRNCSGLTIVGDGLVTFNDAAVGNTVTPFNTNSYKSCFDVSEGSAVKIGANIVNLTLQENQSFYNFSQFTDDDFRGTLVSGLLAGSGDYFAKGYFARSSAAISDGGSSTIIIPVSDTIKFREDDTIVLSESTSYNGLSGTIQSSGIILNTSIQVDIVFSTADTDVLIQDTTITSKDKTTPGVEAFENQDLQDSTITANAFLPSDANLTVTISAINTPVMIGGTWVSSNRERMDFTISGGILTSTAEGTRRILVEYGGFISGGAASVFFTFNLFKNGIDISENPPIIDIINANTGSSTVTSQVVELDKGDTLQLATSNISGTQDPTIRQAHVTVSKT